MLGPAAIFWAAVYFATCPLALDVGLSVVHQAFGLSAFCLGSLATVSLSFAAGVAYVCARRRSLRLVVGLEKILVLAVLAVSANLLRSFSLFNMPLLTFLVAGEAGHVVVSIGGRLLLDHGFSMGRFAVALLLCCASVFGSCIYLPLGTVYDGWMYWLAAFGGQLLRSVYALAAVRFLKMSADSPDPSDRADAGASSKISPGVWRDHPARADGEIGLLETEEYGAPSWNRLSSSSIYEGCLVSFSADASFQLVFLCESVLGVVASVVAAFILGQFNGIASSLSSVWIWASLTILAGMHLASGFSNYHCPRTCSRMCFGAYSCILYSGSLLFAAVYVGDSLTPSFGAFYLYGIVFLRICYVVACSTDDAARSLKDLVQRMTRMIPSLTREQRASLEGFRQRLLPEDAESIAIDVLLDHASRAFSAGSLGSVDKWAQMRAYPDTGTGTWLTVRALPSQRRPSGGSSASAASGDDSG